MTRNKINIDKNYNILSLDGGGIRGIMLLHQLVDLEKKLDRPLHETFDLISGTSTGAIVAVLLGLGHTAENILNIYLKHSYKIFKKHFFRFGIFRPRYDDTYFNNLILKFVSTKTLKDLLCDVIVPAYNATKKEKIIFKSKKAKVDLSYDYKLFDVIRSSVSAQTFFKPHKIGSSYFIDGGMVINNPTLISYIETLGYDIKYDCINILSYSTGIKEAIIDKYTISGGLLNWAQPTFDILLAEQSQMIDYEMKVMGLNYKNLNYIRCESYVLNSSGKICDVSKKNIENLKADGVLSTINNELLVEMFREYL